jgi:hypothetical protein
MSCLENREVLQKNEQQERLGAGGEVGARDRQAEDRVEVDAVQVGAEPPRARKAVGVRDVGVEDGPDHVDADPDHARAGAAEAAGGGVSDLVEAGGQDNAAEQGEKEGGLVERHADRLGDSVGEQQPAVEREERGHGRRDDEWAEERQEEPGDPPHSPVVHERLLPGEPEQRVRLAHPGGSCRRPWRGCRAA